MQQFKIIICFFLIIVNPFFNILSQEGDMNIIIGSSVPSFAANDDNGNLWKLEEKLNQKYLVIYFYPAALTGG